MLLSLGDDEQRLQHNLLDNRYIYNAINKCSTGYSVIKFVNYVSKYSPILIWFTKENQISPSKYIKFIETINLAYQ